MNKKNNHKKWLLYLYVRGDVIKGRGLEVFGFYSRLS